MSPENIKYLFRINQMKMKILVLYGPNLNLLGLWAASRDKTITLDKLNRHIRKYIRNKNIDLKIIQTNDEAKAISYIQNNRKKIDAIITVPGVWQYNAYGISEILELTKIPFITITYKEKDYVKLLNGENNITDEDLYNAMSNALDELTADNEK